MRACIPARIREKPGPFTRPPPRARIQLKGEGSGNETILQVRAFFYFFCLLNPRRACAARVTVVGLCVRPSVRPLIGNSLLERLLVLKTLSRTQWATKVKKICGDLPETTEFKSYAAKQERRSQYANYSDLPAVSFLRLTQREASQGYPTIVNNIQPCPKLCLPMPLAYVGARTDGTSYTATREAWPISAHAHWRSRQDMLYLRRGFSTLVLLVIINSRPKGLIFFTESLFSISGIIGTVAFLSPCL